MSVVGIGHASVTTVASEKLMFYLAQSVLAQATNKTSQPQHRFSTGCARRSLAPLLLYFLELLSRIQVNGLAGAQFDIVLRIVEEKRELKAHITLRRAL